MPEPPLEIIPTRSSSWFGSHTIDDAVMPLTSLTMRAAQVTKVTRTARAIVRFPIDRLFGDAPSRANVLDHLPLRL